MPQLYVLYVAMRHIGTSVEKPPCGGGLVGIAEMVWFVEEVEVVEVVWFVEEVEEVVVCNDIMHLVVVACACPPQT